MADTFSPKANLDADNRIILIRVKIERAKKHLADLEREIRQFRRYNRRRNNSKIVIGNRDLEFREKPDKSAEQGIHISFEAVAIAGDVAQNLRSALDHLVYQLVLVAGGKPTTGNEFPIAENLAAYEARRGRKVEGMRPEAKKMIDAVKPYAGGNDILWRLHDLNRIDKHRVIMSIGRNVRFYGDWFRDPIGAGFCVKASEPDFLGTGDAKTEKKVKFEIKKALTQPKIGRSDSLLPTLHQMVNAVESLVLSFKPLLQR